jgi:hypothetical protein
VRSGRSLDRWTAALAVALLIGLPMLVWLGRGMTFFSDEWAFIESRSLGDPSTWLPPHNEHWSTVPILLYRTLVETVGLSSYVPYLALVVALHGFVVVLVFVAVRRTSGPIVAVAISILLLCFGSGFENVYWGFQIGFVGATAAGVGALLALDRADAAGRAATGLLLLLGLATAGVALAFLVAVGVESILRGRLRAMLVPLAVPIGIYGLWFLAYGRSGVTTRASLSVEALLDVPHSVASGLGNAAGAVFGVGPGLGLIAAAAIALWALVRLLRDRAIPPRFVGCAAGIVTLYGLIGLTRADKFEGIIDYTRYTYLSAILLIIGLSALVGRVTRPAPGRARLALVGVGGGLLAISLVFNARLLIDGRGLFLDRAAMTRALVTVGLERPLPPPTDPDRTLVLVPSPSSLERIVAAYGSPVGDSIVPWAVESIPPDVLAEARRRLIEGAEVPR